MDIYPSKAQFSTNETVTLCLICDDVLPISVHIRVMIYTQQYKKRRESIRNQLSRELYEK